jgi:hypothetical protein
VQEEHATQLAVAEKTFERRLAALDDAHTASSTEERAKCTQLEASLSLLQESLQEATRVWEGKVAAAAGAATSTLQTAIDAQTQRCVDLEASHASAMSEWQRRYAQLQATSEADVAKAHAEVQRGQDERKATLQRLLGETAAAKVRSEEHRQAADVAKAATTAAEHRTAQLQALVEASKAEIGTLQALLAKSACAQTEKEEALKPLVEKNLVRMLCIYAKNFLFTLGGGGLGLSSRG